VVARYNTCETGTVGGYEDDVDSTAPAVDVWTVAGSIQA
jgi:hypothetical protein